MNEPDLPVTHCLAEIVRAVAAGKPVVLKAPPGAGKTTGVPPALLEQHCVSDGRIILVQPRRLAARSTASRLAQLVDCEVGGRVGYQVRFDRKAGKNTELLVVTTGILLRRLQSDPLLEDVGCVILDEFHERSLEIDLALGMLQRIRTTLRPELNLVVMSATLDPDPIVAFLGDAVAIESKGRAYPVDLHHSTHVSRDPIESQVLDALPEMMRRTAGHLLVFLPGIGEIRRTARAISQARVATDSRIMELYGELSPKDQDAVLAPSADRKIVLATNVAETSVTIPGITGVIDSGLARVMRYEANVGLSALRLEKISQASAEQRAGRAGRTEPGVCLRLWPAATHRARRELDSPEIQRADFSAAALMLSAWGERDATKFPWLTSPPVAAVDSANQLLRRLDAIDDHGSLTEAGKQMLSLPLHPRIARFMTAAKQFDMVDSAAVAAALLTERDPFRIPSGNRQAPVDRGQMRSDSDLADRVEQLETYFDGDENRPIHAPAARQIRRVAKQLSQVTDSLPIDPSDDLINECSIRERLRRALLLAFPDRVARRRQAGSDRGLMVGGRGIKLDKKSAVQSSEYFLCIDVDGKGSEALVRIASAIEQEWLQQYLGERLFREVDESFFQPSSQSIATRRRTYFDDLMLSESPVETKTGGKAADLLSEHARRDPERIFPKNNQEVDQFIRRVRFLTENMPELELPKLDQIAIDEVIDQLCRSCNSFARLREAPWLGHLQGWYDYEQLKMIDDQAPSRMTVPSGNAIAIKYADGKPPVMEVRLQELFGWKSTPRIACGRVPVQLHLLGPNHRPQQITEDLENFWSSTYEQVRKDLRRRYPKHHWPEDPTTATATRNGLKPRK